LGETVPEFGLRILWIWTEEVVEGGKNAEGEDDFSSASLHVDYFSQQTQIWWQREEGTSGGSVAFIQASHRQRKKPFDAWRQLV